MMTDLYPELHSHLYGSLDLEDLYYLYSRNEPRWKIFQNSFIGSYGREPDLAGLFESGEKNRKKLESYYYFLEAGDFRKFQTSFDLVIALSSTEPEELAEIVRRVSSRIKGYAELRMLFSPFETDESFAKKVCAICEAMSLENRKRNPSSRIRLAMSLNREEHLYERRYRVLRNLQNLNESVKNELTAVDFCAMEEGFPPSDKSDFVKNVLKENKQNPQYSLAVLYHVGESFSDKSLESGARWVLEAALMGCHRLGHGIALGLDPNLYEGRTVKEIREERIRHIEFLLRNGEDLEKYGYPLDAESLQNELKQLQSSDCPDVEINYGKLEIKRCMIFQNWAMDKIRRLGTVIEVCPTSNIRIANINIKDLSFWRFLENKLTVVLGADDPGILKIQLSGEYALIQEELIKRNMDLEIMEVLRMNAEKSISEKISGRI